MNETSIQANDFLNQIFETGKLDLYSEVAETNSETVFSIKGNDSDLLLSNGAEVLDALQHILTQSSERNLTEGKRFTCDAENYRATREAELRVMAKHAADKVRQSGRDFLFGPMNAVERRIIHTVLSEESDVFTESVGEGANRRLKVALKK